MGVKNLDGDETEEEITGEVYLEDGEEVMLQLLAAPGKVDFYKKFGFKVKLTTAEAGMYMWMKK